MVSRRELSTVLTIDVGTALATKFANHWRGLTATPGGFDLVGNNCSTHASDAFIKAGILRGGIPGLDTPNNLYKQLVKTLPGRTKTYSGYVGFTPKTGASGFDVIVE